MTVLMTGRRMTVLWLSHLTAAAHCWDWSDHWLLLLLWSWYGLVGLLLWRILVSLSIVGSYSFIYSFICISKQIRIIHLYVRLFKGLGKWCFQTVQQRVIIDAEKLSYCWYVYCVKLEEMSWQKTGEMQYHEQLRQEQVMYPVLYSDYVGYFSYLLISISIYFSWPLKLKVRNLSK